MKDNYVAVILEEVREQYRAIQEGIDTLHKLSPKVDTLQADVSQIKNDMTMLKAIVREHHTDIVGLNSIHPGNSHA